RKPAFWYSLPIPRSLHLDVDNNTASFLPSLRILRGVQEKKTPDSLSGALSVFFTLTSPFCFFCASISCFLFVAPLVHPGSGVTTGTPPRSPSRPPVSVILHSAPREHIRSIRNPSHVL